MDRVIRLPHKCQNYFRKFVMLVSLLKVPSGSSTVLQINILKTLCKASYFVRHPDGEGVRLHVVDRDDRDAVAAAQVLGVPGADPETGKN